jgi:hypothetical protein
LRRHGDGQVVSGIEVGHHREALVPQLAALRQDLVDQHRHVRRAHQSAEACNDVLHLVVELGSGPSRIELVGASLPGRDRGDDANAGSGELPEGFKQQSASLELLLNVPEPRWTLAFQRPDRTSQYRPQETSNRLVIRSRLLVPGVITSVQLPVKSMEPATSPNAC